MDSHFLMSFISWYVHSVSEQCLKVKMIAKLLFGKVANSLLQIKEVECFTQNSKYILEKVEKKITKH